MGISIECKQTGLSIDMGYIGFNRLRDKVAELVSNEFGEHIKKLSEPKIMVLSLGFNEEKKKHFFDDFNKKTQKFIADKKVSPKIVDFILQPDCEGKIHYGACKQLLKVIGDYDDNVIYGYAGWENPAKFADFKEILNDCVKNKCDMVWH